MPNRSVAVEAPPKAVGDALLRLGRRIRVARLRRNLRIEDLAARVGVSRFTIAAIEAGKPGVSVAACFGALWALGLDEPLRELADPDRDEEGKALESVRRPRRARPRAGLDNDF
jgi:transcriptional regulator with XRE-family HTH domain